MKILLIGLLALGSISAFAKGSCMINVMVNGEYTNVDVQQDNLTAKACLKKASDVLQENWIQHSSDKVVKVRISHEKLPLLFLEM